MGVIYKLTDDVVQFIMERKTANDRLSCREIAELVAQQYQKIISKSSVHDVLKGHGVAIPRGRKPKGRFRIPPERKQQLFANAPAGVLPPSPPPLIPPAQITPMPAAIPIILARNPEPMAQTQAQARAGEVFLKAAFWDLSSTRPVSSISEWKYISTPIDFFRLELKDGSFFDIDSRFQRLGRKQVTQAFPPATIERAAREAADRILNNINPLCIRAIDKNFPPDEVRKFFMACEEGIKQVSLLNKDGIMVAQFPRVISTQLRFIIGISEKSIVEYDKKIRRIFNDNVGWNEDNIAIYTNIFPEVKDEMILETFNDRHPALQAKFFNSLQDYLQIIENNTDPKKWLDVQLTARAMKLFGLNQEALESILGLQGLFKYNRTHTQITLQIPSLYAYQDALEQSAARANALDIQDENGRKIFIKTASEN